MTPDAFRPDQGKHGAENARDIISSYPSLFTLGDPRILPENLRSDADFMGPFLLCYGMGYLPQASPQVRADPDIRRAVFTESLFDDLRQPVLNGILECLDACLLDRSAGLRGPATMSPGEKRTFENDGLPVDVYCLAQQQERGQGAGTVVVTSLYLACYESEEYGMHDDVAALQVRSELRGKGKKRHWAVLNSAMHTPFNNLLWNESKLDFFSPADDESDDEFDFEDEED